jgi:hypothetical protein
VRFCARVCRLSAKQYVGTASAKNQADFFQGITAAARQSSSAIDLPYMLMYQTQLSEGESIDACP